MKSEFRAVFWMLTAAASFALLAVLFKYVTRSLPPFEMMFARNGGALIFLILYMKLRGKRLIRPVNGRLLAVRAIVGALAMLCYFYALTVLPVAEVVVIHKVSPFVILFLAWAWMNEPVTFKRVFSFVIAMTGVVVVFQPGFARFGWLLVLPLISALLSGIAHTSLRKLAETDEPETIVAGFFVGSMAILIPAMMIEGPRMPGETVEWVLVCSLGLLTAIAQVAMTKAYREAPAGSVALYSYATIPFAALLAFMLFNEIPSAATICGSVLIIVAGWLNTRAAGRISRARFKGGRDFF